MSYVSTTFKTFLNNTLIENCDSKTKQRGDYEVKDGIVNSFNKPYYIQELINEFNEIMNQYDEIYKSENK